MTYDNEYPYECFLIDVGVNLHNTIWELTVIHQYVDYFKECYDAGLSPSKSVFLFSDYVNDIKLGNINKLKDML